MKHRTTRKGDRGIGESELALWATSESPFQPQACTAPTSRSPNDGSTSARNALNHRFSDRLSFDSAFTRRVVSYQGNRRIPGFRWMKYKEGFSFGLVSKLLDEYKPRRVLDPFAGMGTTLLAASGRGIDATGIEIMPVGVLAGLALAEAANGLSVSAISEASSALLDRVRSADPASAEHRFPHIPITRHAFSEDAERDIAKAREFLSKLEPGPVKTLLNLACMTVLESVSYTRKDGQFLRWDHRSGRTLRSKMNKGAIPSFPDALSGFVWTMVSDIPAVKTYFGGAWPQFITGSSLNLLKTLPEASFDLVVTSPPYANRYDYTRTYALELTWLGYGHEDILRLRQEMLSATVENRTKMDTLSALYGDSPRFFDGIVEAYESQSALHEVLGILRAHARQLGNRHVIRLLEGYFLEMAVIVAELGRLVPRGGNVIMVNDNVQYHGEEVPVDFILSDFAEQFGFVCRNIWPLARGKGNSSQQMRKFGRREIRKCVYRWERQ